MSAQAVAVDAPLEVCATIPDLGSLTKEVGGDEVKVTVFAKGPQDAHFMQARPSFIKALSQADLFLQAGLDLEVGWAPRLLQGARNPAVLLGGAGFLDTSVAVTPLEKPAGIIDRSLGDVHPLGNPHYLLDPVNGVLVARAIRDRLVSLRPAKREYFEGRYAAFVEKLATKLLGEKLIEKYDAEKILRLYVTDRFRRFLKAQGDLELLGGWAARMATFRGTALLSDHNTWPYFAQRYGLKIVDHLEPKPGIAPTTRHLAEVIHKVEALKVRGILAVVYFDLRHARFVSEKTGVPVIELAHQCGARPGTDDYLSLCEYNVKQVEKALGGGD
jgi:ABC-type Zn uptake system ZnuABC Zn-binding protein ZnuA